MLTLIWNTRDDLTQTCKARRRDGSEVRARWTFAFGNGITVHDGDRFLSSDEWQWDIHADD